MQRLTFWITMLAMMSFVGCKIDPFGVVKSDAPPPSQMDWVIETIPQVEVQVYYVISASQSADALNAKRSQIVRLLTETQEFFASQMDAHGHGRKTFKIVRNAKHRIDIKLIHLDAPAEHFTGMDLSQLNREIYDFTHRPENVPTLGGLGSYEIAAVFVDIPVQLRTIGWAIYGDAINGGAFVARADTWSWNGWTVGTLAHELGHAMDLHHDKRDEHGHQTNRPNAYIMGNIIDGVLSEGAAAWLNYHRAFNTGATVDYPRPIEVSRVDTLRFEIQIPAHEMFMDYQQAVLIHTMGYTPHVIGFGKPSPQLKNDSIVYSVEFDGHLTEDIHGLEIEMIGESGQILYIDIEE